MTRATDIVVGAGSGLGKASAEALAGRGPLLLVDRDHDAVEALAATLADAEPVVCDITNPGDVARLAKRVDALGALVVSAAIMGAHLRGIPIMDVSLVGVARVFDALADKVVPGSVGIGFSSIAAHFDAPASPEVLAVLDDPLAPDLYPRLRALGVDVDNNLTGYSLAKQGVMRLAGRLAPAWGARGGRVLSLSPGMFYTPMSAASPGGTAGLEASAAATPLGRPGQPAEIGAVVAFLCSPGASFMTGSDVVVGGGAVRWPYGMNIALAPGTELFSGKAAG